MQLMKPPPPLKPSEPEKPKMTKGADFAAAMANVNT